MVRDPDCNCIEFRIKVHGLNRLVSSIGRVVCSKGREALSESRLVRRRY